MNLNYINYIFTAFIVVMCIVLSCFALFTPLLNKMGTNQRYILVVVLMVYASFRTYRLLKSIREEKSKNDDL